MLFVEVYTDSNEITFSIELFQSELVAYRPQRTGGYDAHPVAKTLGFLHLVSGQEYGPFCSAGGEHLPQMAPVLRVKASGGLIHEDYPWVSY